MATVDIVPGIRPEPEYELQLPITGEHWYDPFVAVSDVLSPEEAFERTNINNVSIQGLDYPEQTKLKLRLETGNRPSPPISTSHAPENWTGKITEVGFDSPSTRYVIIYESKGKHLIILVVYHQVRHHAVGISTAGP